jgi:hypothetical protein
VKRALEVLLGDGSRRINTLHRDPSGAREHAAFTYDPPRSQFRPECSLETFRWIKTGPRKSPANPASLPQAAAPLK